VANVVYLSGNLIRSAEAVPTQTGRPMARLRVAAEREYTDARGVLRAKSEYLNVVCFGGNALYVMRHGEKGRAIVIEASLRERKLDTPEGARYTAEIVADRDAVRLFPGGVVPPNGVGLIPRDAAAGEVDAQPAPGAAQPTPAQTERPAAELE
jgi:single-stranded DNA-binding protein